MFTFLHSSDLHIGKRFGNLPEDLRGRLREARHGTIARLADAARRHGASTGLLAGDTFDTETPTPAILRQALIEMAQSAPLRWVLLPGNHDSLLADQLWNAARGSAPDNVILATDAAPIMLAPDVMLMPAPCTTRRPGRDLTEWMDGAATPDGMLRIGLAHGPIRDFSEDGAGTSVIAPNRATLAGLDYMALGDWHGPVAIDARTRYSGTPEPDRFKHDVPGQAMIVSPVEKVFGSNTSITLCRQGSISTVMLGAPSSGTPRTRPIRSACSGRVGRKALRKRASGTRPCARATASFSAMAVCPGCGRSTRAWNIAARMSRPGNTAFTTAPSCCGKAI